ncbi:MAG: SLBB domain-containing protein, partial [Candidatus Krumholzibacteria bacterium]|nr:SLBB domain-containing protein [Candidatus Krumholzibacteria bacterium]
DGDILNVPAIYQAVAVGGEVQEPGKFPYQSDWTVIQYIGLAGGPTQDGSVSRVVIYSPDGTSRNVGKDTRPNRGDVIIVKRSKRKILGEFFSGLVRLGTVVISIIVLTD